MPSPLLATSQRPLTQILKRRVYFGVGKGHIKIPGTLLAACIVMNSITQEVIVVGKSKKRHLRSQVMRMESGNCRIPMVQTGEEMGTSTCVQWRVMEHVA